MPVTENLPEAWYVSPNAHLCTIKDFADLCRVVDARVERAVAFNASGQQLGTWIPLTVHNLMGEKAVFMLTRATWGALMGALMLPLPRACGGGGLARLDLRGRLR